MPNSLYSDLCDVYDEGKKPYLFISYAHEDTTKVVAAIRGLQRLGYRIWYDMGISAGAQWPEDVADHIFGCDAVLAFMTPNSIQSDNCREELFYAKKCNKKILLAYLDKCDLTHGMDMRLGMLQAIERWRCKDDEEFYTRLAKAKNLQPCRGETLAANSDTASESVPQPKAATNTSKTKIEQLREKAENGDAQAQVDLGDAYYNAIGTPVDRSKAFSWYKKAADQNHPIGLRRVGYCYDMGHGIAPNMNEAIKYYQKAAALGDPAAINNLANCYEYGEGVEKDIHKAIELYQNAANLEEPLSIRNLGLLYLRGKGVPLDMNTGMELLHKAAELGSMQAQGDLALRYASGLNVKQSWDTAVQWYRRAADQGDPAAQRQMSTCYRKGLGVPVDLDEAAKWQKLYDENPNKK